MPAAATSLRSRKWASLIWARAISSKGTVKATLGSVNIPVVCAGVNVEPGDAIVADDDGVVVVPKKYAAETAAKAQKRFDDEDAKRTEARLRHSRPRHVQYARAFEERRADLRRQSGGRVKLLVTAMTNRWVVYE